MPEPSPQSDVRSSLLKYAAFCLNRRPYFVETLRQKLILRSKKLKLGDTSEEIAKILADLRQSGYLNDSYLAGAFVRRQLSKGYGPRIIKLKLNMMKLDPGTIEIALDEDADIPQQTAAIEKYASRYRKLDRRQIVSRLYSRGFSFAVINKVFDAEYIED